MPSTVAKYASLVKKKVDVLYRDGDIRLRATGTLVADSGKSIFIEEQFPAAASAKGKTFRWEIPYPHLYRVEESAGEAAQCVHAAEALANSAAPL